MKNLYAFFIIIFGCLFLSNSLFANKTNDKASTAEQLQVFVRDGCPHCAEAKIYLKSLASQRPDIIIIIRSLDTDKTAREELEEYFRAVNVWPPGVPTFVANGKILIGFESPEITGPQIINLFEQQSKPSGVVESSLFGTISVKEIGLPVFTLALGLLDGFNPCAMWVLLFLLSLLVRLQDRQRMIMVAGTFVLVSGAVYYAFMAAWLNVFLILGFSLIIRMLLGGIALLVGIINIKDFVTDKAIFTLSISETKKSGIYARVRKILSTKKLFPSLVAVASLAIIVNFVELLCTAGLPAIYTAVLAQQDISLGSYYGYLLLYILAYMADDALMVTIAVIALNNLRLTEKSGRWLKLLSGLVMFILGVVLLLQPDWLI